MTSSDKERVVSLCIGLFYVGLSRMSTQDTRVGFYWLVYGMFACWLIWYPDQVSRIQFSRRFRTHMRIPPLYIRYLGWVILLGPAAVAFAGAIVMLPFQQ